jgi:hypothetical protein
MHLLTFRACPSRAPSPPLRRVNTRDTSALTSLISARIVRFHTINGVKHGLVVSQGQEMPVA